MGDGTRVSVIADFEDVQLTMVSGASKLAMQLAATTARAVATELHRELPPGEPVTRRPSVNFDKSPKPDWPRLVARLRSGKPIPSDAEHVAHLLAYLGVKTA